MLRGSAVTDDSTFRYRLGKADGVEGFIVAAGHEGDGIALSPITGRIIAEFVATGKMPAGFEISSM